MKRTQSSEVCVLRAEQEQVNGDLVTATLQCQPLVEVRRRTQIVHFLKKHK